jgi:hypothetical protein
MTKSGNRWVRTGNHFRGRRGGDDTEQFDRSDSEPHGHADSTADNSNDSSSVSITVNALRLR